MRVEQNHSRLEAMVPPTILALWCILKIPALNDTLVQFSEDTCALTLSCTLATQGTAHPGKPSGQAAYPPGKASSSRTKKIVVAAAKNVDIRLVAETLEDEVCGLGENLHRYFRTAVPLTHE